MNLQPIEDAWQKLAERLDIIGRPFVYDNRVGGTKDEGTVSKITMEDDHVTIEWSEPEGTPAHHAGWEPKIKFRINEGRDPHQVGNTIFCDLDDRRLISISL